MSRLILRMSSGGVRLGAIRPNQGFTSKSAKPASAMVGMLANEAARFALVTAIGCSVPLRIDPATDGRLVKTRSICPPIRSFSAGAAPR